MRIIENKVKESESKRITCPYCSSVFEYDNEDIVSVCTGELSYIKCPCCSEEIVTSDDEDYRTRSLNFPKSFYHFSKDHKDTYVPSNEYINNEIKRHIKKLHGDGEDGSYYFSATGSNVIIVQKRIDEVGKETYNIIVSNDYYETDEILYDGV